MARTDYQHQLEQLCESVLELSDLVCQRLRRALEAYGRNDTALAERVITGDHAINQLYLEIEGDCIDLLALQQPVASDLRLIASSFKIITDLERVGDLAVNLAEYTQRTTSDRYAEIDITRIGEKNDSVGRRRDAGVCEGQQRCNTRYCCPRRRNRYPL